MSDKRGVRGLATVALLKTQYDQGHDHIEMFMPFVVDILDSLDPIFSTDSARAAIQSEHGLKIPLETMATLLNRAKKRQLVRREGGAYHKEGLLSATSLREARNRIEEEHRLLGTQFLDYAAEHGQPLPDPDEALALVFAFVSQNEVELLLEQDVELADLVPSGPSRRRARLVARFIQDVVLTDAALEPLLRRMLEGFVLQNTLLLKDIRDVSRQFRDLSVFYDSGFLFGLLGLHGAPQETACREAVELVAGVGARLGVFEKTLQEMRAILAMYERKLGTQEGRESLYQTPLTRYLLTSHATPSEVRQVSALLEQTFRGAGIHPTPSPARVEAYTLDEKELSQRLKRPDESINEPRVVHDVDCIAAVLTLRRGKVIQSIDTARAIFVTDSGHVIRTVGRWCKDQGLSGVPPIIYHTTLSNLAWLKRPASGATLKMSELVALCSAALQPDRKTWGQFLAHLKKLEESGAISTDEAVAVVVSSFTDKLLAELEDEAPDAADIDAESLTEVIERVKATYRAQQDEVIAAKSAEAVTERQARIATVGAVETASRKVARGAAWVISGIGVLAIVVGSVLLLPGVIDGVPSKVKPWTYTFVGVAAIAAVWALLTGDSVIGLRRRLEGALHSRITRWFSPDK